jgi:hypothetical protein
MVVPLFHVFNELLGIVILFAFAIISDQEFAAWFEPFLKNP